MSKLPPIPLCKTASLGSFVGTLRVIGAPVETGLRRAKLPVGFEDRPDSWLPYLRMRAFVADLAAREGIADLGARAATISGEGGIDPVLRARLWAFPTVFQMLRALPALAATQSSHLRVWVERHEDMIRLCHANAVGPQVPGYREVDTHATLQIAEVIRHYCGPDWLPTRVFVRRDGGPCAGFGHTAPFAEAGVQASLHDRHAGFEFPVRLLWRRPDRPAGEVPTAGRRVATAPTTVTGALRSCLAGYVGHEALPIELGAEMTGMSARTLQRSLTAEQTSFSAIVERVRFDAACADLVDENIPLAEIALKLGYSEQSAFSRAFRRWTGTTPGQFRRSALKERRA